jgi:hypothetical protein
LYYLLPSIVKIQTSQTVSPQKPSLILKFLKENCWRLFNLSKNYIQRRCILSLQQVLNSRKYFPVNFLSVLHVRQQLGTRRSHVKSKNVKGVNLQLRQTTPLHEISAQSFAKICALISKIYAQTFMFPVFRI